MQVKIEHLIEGAKRAEGLTVIIDVFRAFSLECYLYASGVERIIPVGAIEEAYQYKKDHPEYILIGERHGKICEGFDYGNSPSQVEGEPLQGKTIIHTTSSGTQGIANAAKAEEIITGSLVNAKAVADYIKIRQPDQVTLVCMGRGGREEAKEDELCALYIESLLLDHEMKDIKAQIRKLQYDGGQHFFDPTQQKVFPEKDFWMCIQYNRFNFILKVIKEKQMLYMKKIEV